MSDYIKPILTIDVVLVTLINLRLHVALMTRSAEPFSNALALPGGYIHAQSDVDTDAAARRILKSKLEFTPNHLEQVYTASGMTRDPRGWSASVVYLALHEPAMLEGLAVAGKVTLHDVHEGTALLPGLAFDHAELISNAIARLRGKAGYTSIAGYLLPPEFSMTQFREAVQVMLGKPLNNANFRRKVAELGLLKEVSIKGSQGRPAQQYSLVKSHLISFNRDLG